MRGGEKERKGKVRNREGGKVQVRREMRERVKVCKEREKKRRKEMEESEGRKTGVKGEWRKLQVEMWRGGGVKEIACGGVIVWRCEGKVRVILLQVEETGR